ncbi:MAG: hypothetical protein PHQ64_03070 [Bacilli bacterium]|nr:hypothetical protein [Bacilli bacterium]
MNYKRQQKITIIKIILLLVLTCVICYFLYETFKKEKEETGSITYYYTESYNNKDNSLTIKNEEPIEDKIGKISSGINRLYSFKVTGKSNSTKDINYEIVVSKNVLSTISSKYIKVYLTEVDENNKEIEIPLTISNDEVIKYENLPNGNESLSNGKRIYEGVIKTTDINYEKNFKLRIWISEDTKEELDDKYFNLKVNVYSRDVEVAKEETKINLASIDTKLEEGNKVTLKDGTEYRVLESSLEGIGTVKLISEYNLDEDGEQNKECSMINYNDCSFSYMDIEDNILERFTNNIKTSLNDKSIITRIPTRDELEKMMLNTNNNLWIYSTNYWTSTKYNDNYYSVDGNSNKIVDTNKYINNYYGIRPVIEVSKNHIIND